MRNRFFPFKRSMPLDSIRAANLTNALIETLTHFLLINVHVFSDYRMPKTEIGIGCEDSHAIGIDIWLRRYEQGDHGCGRISVHKKVAVAGDRFTAKVVLNVAGWIIRKDRE